VTWENAYEISDGLMMALSLQDIESVFADEACKPLA